ncbi:hypothetical protein A9Q81_20750 [Gammaproteobacteria bacterium 42_54_T18]|nr:hypothetical protein A9Q81_20750 [Gammaproteobacteria bacterium 42_54_T18]
MDMLERIRKSKPLNYESLDKAFAIVNDEQLTFSNKVAQVEQLERQAKGQEAELFGDVYSSLHLLAKSEEDMRLISGKD